MRPSRRSDLSDHAVGKVKTDIFVIAGFLCCLLCHCTRDDQQGSERYILESERQWAESVATGDASTVQRILADDFLGVDPKGQHYDKAKMIADTRTAPQYFASNRLNEVKVRFYGDNAIAQGHKTWERRTGERGRFVWTDTWIRRNRRWQIVAAEDLIAPESIR
jgi:ketosteroid isomerase-like protein